jgi:hypothetical protein
MQSLLPFRPFPSLQYKRAKPRPLQLRLRRRLLPVVSGGHFGLGGDGELRFWGPMYIFHLTSLDLDRFGACVPVGFFFVAPPAAPLLVLFPRWKRA